MLLAYEQQQDRQAGQKEKTEGDQKGIQGVCKNEMGNSPQPEKTGERADLAKLRGRIPRKQVIYIAGGQDETSHDEREACGKHDQGKCGVDL